MLSYLTFMIISINCRRTLTKFNEGVGVLHAHQNVSLHYTFDKTPPNGTPFNGTLLNGTPLVGSPLDGTPSNTTPLEKNPFNKSPQLVKTLCDKFFHPN